GINYEDFPKQLAEREKRTMSAKDKAEAEKSKAVSARQNWLTAQQIADKATGRTGALYDPMAPQAGGPTTAGGGLSQEKPQVVQPLSSGPTQPTQPTPAVAPAPAPEPTTAPAPQQ